MSKCDHLIFRTLSILTCVRFRRGGRDALSGQSCELSVAKANEAGALVAPKSEEPYEGDGKTLFRVKQRTPIILN